MNDNVYHYEPYVGAFKTGDIIVYSGFGILAALTKARSSGSTVPFFFFVWR